MTYSQALNVLINRQSLGIKPGLNRINNILNAVDNPQDKMKIIHIAGTNGKGTVACTIAEALKENNLKTGLFTSPWVTDYREQIQINNEFISEDDFTYYVEKYKNFDATEFELVTALMYKYFYDSGVDFAVVECGMGGKGDATNTEKNNISVITSVSLDHTDFLGKTVEEIAFEKAGIIKSNSTCVLYPNEQTEHIFEKVCKEKHTKLVKVLKKESYSLNNLAVAEAVIKELGLNLPTHLTVPPARIENINGVILDGGHNVEAAEALTQALKGKENTVAIIGMMADKNVEGYLKIIAPLCKAIITVTPNNKRSMPAAQLRGIAEKYCENVIAIDNPQSAFALAKDKGLSLVCGSFYLAREIRKELLR